MRQEYPRIYNLFPRLAGPMHQWFQEARHWLPGRTKHVSPRFNLLGHIAGMGFNTVYVNPHHLTSAAGKDDGANGSLYAMRDHFLIDPAFMPDHLEARSHAPQADTRTHAENQLEPILASKEYQAIYETLYALAEKGEANKMGAALSAYATEPKISDYFQKGAQAETQFVKAAHGKKLKVWSDLVLGHMAKDHPLVLLEQKKMEEIARKRKEANVPYDHFVVRDAAHENRIIAIQWKEGNNLKTYHPLFVWGGNHRKDDALYFHRENGGAEWNDVALVNYANPQTKQFFTEYWKQVITRHLEAGMDGFRCDAAYNIPADVWEPLMKYAYDWTRARRKDKPQWMAETVGASAENNLTLKEVHDPANPKDVGFDHAMSSEVWWNPGHALGSPPLVSDWSNYERGLLQSIAKEGGVGPLSTHDTSRAVMLAAEEHLRDCMRYGYTDSYGWNFARAHNLSADGEIRPNLVKQFLSELSRDNPMQNEERKALMPRIVGRAARAAIGNNGWIMSMGDEWGAGKRNWVFDPKTTNVALWNDRHGTHSPFIEPDYFYSLLRERVGTEYDVSEDIESINHMKRALPAGSREISRQVVAFAPPERVMIVRRQMTGPGNMFDQPSTYVLYNVNPSQEVLLAYEPQNSLDFWPQDYRGKPITLNLARLEKTLNLKPGELLIQSRKYDRPYFTKARDSITGEDQSDQLKDFRFLTDALALEKLTGSKLLVESNIYHPHGGLGPRL